MFKSALIALLLTFALTPFQLQAQTQPVPWPPNPDAIFTEGVEVVDVEFHEYSEIVVDNEARSVKVFDNENATWHEFNYSEEIMTLIQYADNFEKRSDGTVLFNIPISFNAIPEDWPEMWLLNPQTGEFSHPEIICGKYPQALPDEGDWVFYVDPQVNRTTLCNTETGELKGIFSRHLYWQSASQNPTGEFLLLEASKEELAGSMTIIQYFSYNLSTGALRYLGEFQKGEVDYMDDIRINNEIVLVYSGYMSESLGGSYYRLDLTQPNSAEFLISGRAWEYENPHRLEYLRTYWEVLYRSNWGAPCEINVYDMQADTSYSKTLGSNCFGRVQRRGNYYFYVSLNSEDSNLLSLYRLDMTTDETQEWMDCSFGKCLPRWSLCNLHAEQQPLLTPLGKRGRSRFPHVSRT